MNTQHNDWLSSGFKDAELMQNLVNKITPLANELNQQLGRPVQIMEVCGGHTHTLFRYGINTLFERNIEFIHGPGCPVCVLPREVIDQCIAWLTNDNCILASFGDAIRVPGTTMSLQQARAQGRRVEVVYSPLDALNLAKKNPDKEVIFLAIGFDTTMPSTALTVLQAAAQNITNFSIYPVHITLIPTLKVVLGDSSIMLDGLIGPGHVSMVIGTKPYDFIANDYGLPFVVAGFEPLDVLQSLYMLLMQKKQVMAGADARVENQYARAVLTHGNANALRAMAQVYTPQSKSIWQGLGANQEVGVTLQAEYNQFNAEFKFGAYQCERESTNLTPIYCDQVIMGKRSPSQCPNYGKTCTPQSPLGALMVSSEGACAAWYLYNGATA